MAEQTGFDTFNEAAHPESGVSAHENEHENENEKEAKDRKEPGPLTVNSDALTSSSSAGLQIPSKVGSRFSSRAIRILRAWFLNHEDYPYPSVEDLETLQAQTALNKVQVTNWFANTRRRYKLQSSSRPQSPLVQGGSTPNDIHLPSSGIRIPPRPPTPALSRQTSPLQRWQNSPPEHEAADVSDIKRAIAASSPALPSTPGSWIRGSGGGGGSGRSSGRTSSLSSAATSSNGSESSKSARSHGSQTSFWPFEIRKRTTRRRKNRSVASKPYEVIPRPSLFHKRDTYQCTFCTETFKTKHDWQRHEKSLHLSLEEWVCSPKGPRAVHPDKGKTVCVYCLEEDPDEVHLFREHNHTICVERPLEGRTFYRKDHLQQHLKLVHGTRFLSWPMAEWKTVSVDVRSRCGFCEASLETWVARAEHLAAHFKSGSTMADWKGDWGFEPSVMGMLNNAMPPYLIAYEQNSPLPFSANQDPTDSPASAYELIKLELEYFASSYADLNGSRPSDQDLQYEGCSVILGADCMALTPASSTSSWLRDVFLSSDELVKRARLRPIQHIKKSRLTQLKVNGKGNMFEECELELLLGFAFRSLPALSPREIQQKACDIVSQVEASSPNPSPLFTEFLCRLVWGSATWIEPLRQRHIEIPKSLGLILDSLPSSPMQDLPNPNFYNEMDVTVPLDDTEAFPQLISSSIWEEGMHPYQFPTGPRPDDANNAQQESTGQPNNLGGQSIFPPANRSTDFLNWNDLAYSNPPASSSASHDNARKPRGSPFFLDDNNSYRRLGRELSRYVAKTMSPHNPNCHIPSDQELRYQARWIIYDDDDPWNQTAADNEVWLTEFKRHVGLIADGSSGKGTSLVLW